MHYIALSSHQYTLLFPQVIGNMISAHTQVKGFFRYPEVGQNIICILLIHQGKHQHEYYIKEHQEIKASASQIPWALGDGEHSVSGMLLYAKTDEELQPDNSYQMSGNKISVRMRDLNQEFPEIVKQLDNIAVEHFGGTV